MPPGAPCKELRISGCPCVFCRRDAICDGRKVLFTVASGRSPRPGQIGILDNLRQHQGTRTRELIEARGAELWFLPASSPDRNAIIGRAVHCRRAVRRG